MEISPLNAKMEVREMAHITLRMLICLHLFRQAFNSFRLPIKEFNSWAEVLGAGNNHGASEALKLML